MLRAFLEPLMSVFEKKYANKKKSRTMYVRRAPQVNYIQQITGIDMKKKL